MNRYRLRVIVLAAPACLADSSCTSDGSDRQGNNIVYGENIIGSEEQTSEIEDHQYLEWGTYLVKGWCYVTYSSTLTIEAGIVIKGGKETRVAPVIEPDEKLIAQGTMDVPTISTSETPAGKRRPGNQGGLIFCGYAWDNENIMQIEGGSCTMHDDLNSADNSGILGYVRIESTGYPFKKSREIDGVTSGSVGNDTQIDHLQVSYANDGTFEQFGGMVNAEYLAAYHCWDDDFDTDNGYNGTYKHLLGTRHPRIADITSSHAFERSNNGTDSPVIPVAAATFEDVMTHGPTPGGASFANRPNFINGSGLWPESESMLGLFGSALYLGAGTSVTFRNCRISGYPSDMEGTPTVIGNIVFSEKEEINYLGRTKG